MVNSNDLISGIPWGGCGCSLAKEHGRAAGLLVVVAEDARWNDTNHIPIQARPSEGVRGLVMKSEVTQIHVQGVSNHDWPRVYQHVDLERAD